MLMHTLVISIESNCRGTEEHDLRLLVQNFAYIEANHLQCSGENCDFAGAASQYPDLVENESVVGGHSHIK